MSEGIDGGVLDRRTETAQKDVSAMLLRRRSVDGWPSPTSLLRSVMLRSTLAVPPRMDIRRRRRRELVQGKRVATIGRLQFNRYWGP